MIAVMIVEENRLLRAALVEVLAREPELRVTAAVGLADDPLTAARADPPAVVLVNAAPHHIGEVAALTGTFAVALPTCRVLLLTEATAATARSALTAGVWGLVSADLPPAELAQVIRQVAAGDRPVDPTLAAAALRASANPLTAQERAALRLAGLGLPTREVAARLFLSPGTVRNHLSGAIRKTGARNRLEAVRRAQRSGWL